MLPCKPSLALSVLDSLWKMQWYSNLVVLIPWLSIQDKEAKELVETIKQHDPHAQHLQKVGRLLFTGHSH